MASLGRSCLILLLATAGVLAAAGSSAHQYGSAQAGHVGARSVAIGSAALLPSALYYKLSGLELKTKGWPHDYLKYSIFVADPGLSTSVLAQIRRDLPGRQLVACVCPAHNLV